MTLGMLFTRVPPIVKQYNVVLALGRRCHVTTGMAEYNHGSLPLGLQLTSPEG